MIRITPTSIAHCACFCLVAGYSFYWFTVTAVSGSDRFMDKKNQLVNNRFVSSDICYYHGSEYTPPANRVQSQVIGYYKNKKDLPILATSNQNSWSISEYNILTGQETAIVDHIDFSGTKLSVSYQPIYNLIAYPQCDTEKCQIVIWSVADQHEVRRITAIDSYGRNNNSIDNLFFDADVGFVSYTMNMSDISSRVVLSYEGRLLQSIDESPGLNRQLQFIGYLPESKQLVYRDLRSNDRFLYSADSINLVRQPCSQ